MDEIAELADRLRAKQRRGEEPGLEFEVDFASLTAAEQDAFLALLAQRIAHGKDRKEALDESLPVLRALLDLVASSGAPPGTTLGEALQVGYISVLEVVESICDAEPDPLAG